MSAVGSWIASGKWLAPPLPRHWAEGAVDDADAVKSGGFGGNRSDFSGKIRRRPRRYVAAEIFRGVSAWLWTSAAAVQLLAFLLL
jgi:hypothetical protein